MGVYKIFSIVFFAVILLSYSSTSVLPDAFASGGPATIALGQPGLASALSNVSGNSLDLPLSTVMDGSGNVWVADTENNRVLRYDAALSNGQPAIIVLGQPTLSSNGINTGGLSDKSLNSPRGLAIDGSGNLWVVDSGNNRVLRFSVGGGFSTNQVADLVLGQPDFTSNSANNGGIDSGTLSSPRGITIDTSNYVWVADSGNNRVLKFITPSTATGETADLVIGQSVFDSSSSGLSNSTLDSPNGVEVDTSGNVWVADSDNNRVLKFNTPSTDGEEADMVLGQPNYVSNGGNQFDVTAGTLNKPQDVAVAGSDVWVADGANNRLLRYDSPAFEFGETANIVLGHDKIDEGDPNFGGISSVSLFSPQSVMVDGSDVWTADSANNRVLKYVSPATTGSAAGLVLGQSGMTSNTSGSGLVAANRLSLSQNVVFDTSGNAWVADTTNNRVLRFSVGGGFTPNQAADLVLGQPDFTSNTINQGGLVGSTSLSSPTDLAFDPAGNLWVVDSGNSRVLQFIVGGGFSTNQAASIVLGQADMNNNHSNQGGAVDSDTLSFPQGIEAVVIPGPGLIVAVADTGNDRVSAFIEPAGNGPSAAFIFGGSGPTSHSTMSAPTDVNIGQNGIWVSDTGNNRVIEIFGETGLFTTVLGQPDFTSNIPNNGGVLANTLSGPGGLVWDTNGFLWVTDSGNHRVLTYAPSPLNGTSAVHVLAQLDFASSDPNTGGVSASTLSTPQGISIDSSNNLLVADSGNNRVLSYPYVDTDTDGFSSFLDCDDTDGTIFPGAPEIIGDGIDQDCDGQDAFDGDGDGHASEATGGDDCNDTDETIFPGAFDVPDDGIDQDCDGFDAVSVPVDNDFDNDGHDSEASGGDDCDDTDGTIFPGAPEIIGDGIDQDCDGQDAQDGGNGGGDHGDVLNAIENSKQMLLDEIGSSKQMLLDEIGSSKQMLSNEINSMDSSLSNQISQMSNHISGKIDSLQSGIFNQLTQMNNILNNMFSELGRTGVNVDEINSNVRDNVDDLQLIKDQITQLQLQTGDGAQTIDEINSNVSDNVDDLQLIKDQIAQLQLQTGDGAQKIDISISEADGKESFLILTTVNGLPVDVSIDQILIVKKKGEISILTPADYETTALDEGLFTLKIDKKAFKDKKSIELLVSFSDDGNRLYGAILFDDKLNKNTSQ
jgi:hypothetical protein